MKATSKIKDGIMFDVKEVILIFDDDLEVTLDEITDIDIDLDNIDYSTIDITSALGNTDLINRFCDANHFVKTVHVEYDYYNIKNLKDDNKLFIDIPCKMNIRKFRINGDTQITSSMFIRLEGLVV